MTRNKGFTLLEVIIAIFVITIGVVGVFAFLQNTVFSGATIENQLAVAYLAQEGVEIVRSIRDTNYVRIARGGGGNWDDGLKGCPGDEYQGDYLDVSLQCFSGGSLNRSGNFYVHGAGTPTIFQRKITISPSGDRLDTSVEIRWQEQGNPHTFVVATELYNWVGF